MKCTMSVLIPILSGLVLTILFVFPVVGFSELTEKDLEKIRKIVQSEVNTIKQDITEVELRLIEKILESENRLQTQFNQSLDNRTNSIMIIFAVVSMGFFLLFGCILLVGALRNRQPNKKLIILMVISLAGVMLCRVPSLDAQKDKFGDIICKSLTVVDDKGKNAIVLKTNEYEDNEVIVYHPQGREGIKLQSGSWGNYALVFENSDNKHEAAALAGTSTENYVIVRNFRSTDRAAAKLISKENVSSVEILDKGGNPRVWLTRLYPSHHNYIWDGPNGIGYLNEETHKIVRLR